MTHASARTTTSLKSCCDDLPRGAQFVCYRVFSADGHPVGRSLVFSIGMSRGTVLRGPRARPGLPR